MMLVPFKDSIQYGIFQISSHSGNRMEKEAKGQFNCIFSGGRHDYQWLEKDT